MMLRILENPTASVWRDFDRWNEELTKSIVSAQSKRIGIAVNVYQREEGATLLASVPGVAMEDLEISVLENTVHLKGKRKEWELAEGTKAQQVEWYPGEFARAIELPFKIHPDKVTATLQNGILQIQVLKREEDQPRKISITQV